MDLLPATRHVHPAGGCSRLVTLDVYCDCTRPHDPAARHPSVTRSGPAPSSARRVYSDSSFNGTDIDLASSNQIAESKFSTMLLHAVHRGDADRQSQGSDVPSGRSVEVSRPYRRRGHAALGHSFKALRHTEA